MPLVADLPAPSHRCDCEVNTYRRSSITSSAITNQEPRTNVELPRPYRARQHAFRNPHTAPRVTLTILGRQQRAASTHRCQVAAVTSQLGHRWELPQTCHDLSLCRSASRAREASPLILSPGRLHENLQRPASAARALCPPTSPAVPRVVPAGAAPAPFLILYPAPTVACGARVGCLCLSLSRAL
jgi:hypothetical protein